MHVYRRLLSFLTVAMMLVCWLCPADARPHAPGASASSRATVLQVFNASNMAQVPTTITVGAGTICGSYTISQIQVTVAGRALTINPLNSMQGWFNLPKGQIATVTNKQGSCLAGINIAFLAPPQCPCTTCTGFTPGVPGSPQPNGVNQAELTLNPGAPNQETVDISCATGANSAIQIAHNGGGAPWVLPNNNQTNAFFISNSWVNVAGRQDNNCSSLAVLPYQYSTCTGGSACSGAGPFCTNSRPTICYMRRPPVNGLYGGVVRVTYNGPISPP